MSSKAKTSNPRSEVERRRNHPPGISRQCSSNHLTSNTSGKNLTWYSFRHTWITIALERGVPIATVCNNCDTSIQYVQEHYFHYDAKRATDAFATGRGESKGSTGTE